MKTSTQQALESILIGRPYRLMRHLSMNLMSTAFLIAAFAALPGISNGQCSLPEDLVGCNGTCPTPYSEVDNILSPNGRDDNYNVLIGGNLTVNDAAEMEGKIYIGGDLTMNRFSGYNMGYVGLGSGVVPSNNTDWVTVAGNVNVPNFPAGYILGPDAAPDFLGNFIYGGFLTPLDLDGIFPDVINFASEANIPTNTAPFDEMFNQLAAISACLGAKSQSPASDITFADTGGGGYTITEVSEADVYIINLSSDLSSATLNFVGFEGNETIVINVDKPGSGDVITIDIAGTQRNGSPAGEGASSGTVAFSLREGILWNFPDASSVTISGGQLQGSVLVPGATVTTTMSASGLNGRFWVEGNAIHGGSGSEFHAFPFRGNLPLTCCDYGDLPDLTSITSAGDYQTLLANDGPRHLIDNAIRMGASIDGEGDGQQSTIADGDDTNTDDEDGIATFPTFYAGQSADVTVNVTNTTGSPATLYGWIDFNNDGLLDNATERSSVSVPSGTAGNVILSFNAPGGAATLTDLGARFRLSTDPDAANATGSADDGEVEDYVVQIQPPLLCDISITDVQVSGCNYNIGVGESQATVTVEVSWVNPPVGENIFVSLGAQTKFINVVGGVTSPATVSFTVLADGSLGNTIDAAFSGNTCTTSDAYDAPAACLPAGCLLNIVEVGVGECVNNATTGNVPTALVSVQVEWINQPPGSLIEITFDGLTKTINPNENGNPEYVQFMANLNSATPMGNVTAQFSPGSCNVATAPYVLPAACSPTTPCAGPNAIGGNVFSDFDSDGKKDASEFGLEGIVVDVFDCDGNLLCTTTTDFNGDWTCTGLANGQEVRVEFYQYPAPYVTAAADDNNQAGRTNDGGSVQFATVGSDCQVDFGLINIADFCQNNPFLIVPCWVRGNPLLPGTSADMPVMVAIPYQASGNQQQNNVQHTYLATNEEIGPTWGVAYNRNTNTVFASALLRRHSGWGPDSLSAIYKIDVSQVPAPSVTGNSSLYVDLDDQFGIDAADEYSITRDLSPNLTVPSFDPQVFDLVGKAGLGDIDISADFDSIFVVNLYTRSLVIIQNDPNTDTPLSATEIPIPDPNCLGGESDWRPWALKYHKGVLYVGGVCSGQTNQNDQEMIGVVYAFDPLTSSFTQLLSFDLDYPKGSPASWLGNPSADCKNWNPWTANFSDLIESGVELCYPQPILTDIEFDVYGNMTLGFVDRMGLQGGWFDYDTSPPTSQAYKSNLGGDILRVYNNNGHYLLEKDAVAGYTTGCGSTQAAPGQGPGGGEFYCQDAFGSAHQETAQGGLALHPSNNEIVTAVMDPLGAFSAGLAWYNNGTGVSTRQYEVYYSGNSGTTGLFGKAAGLGDLELTCSEPSQQIGNFLFIDENINGIQDPCDTPIPGIDVSLYSTSGALIATTTTDADGYYYFNTSDGLLPETDYYIVFGTGGEWSGTTLSYLGDAYSLTLANIGAAPRNDLNDSDASIAGPSLPAAIQGFPYILATTPQQGTSDHSFDAGFILPSFSVGSTVFLDINEDGVQNGGEPGLPNIAVQLYQAGDVPGVDTPVATDMTDGNGDYFFGSLLAGDYFVYVPAPPGIAPASSAGAGIADSDTDGNDDGVQASFGGPSQSGIFTLSFSNEPVDGAGETGQGNLQDNFDDANGNMTIDFGFIPAVSVGSTVFYDENNNGIQDGGEPGIDGVSIQLYSVGLDGQPNTMDDILVDTDVTTGGGNYFFFGLPQGNYYLVIPTPPADYTLSSTTDELDPNSDVDENDNGLQPGGAGAPVQSGIITLTVNGEPVNGAGESGPGSGQDDFDDNNGNSTVDFGFIPAVSVGSLVFADLENNGLYDGADFGIDGVEVELWSTGADGNKGTADDAFVASDITSGGGVYFIGNLPQGEYYLKIQSSQFGAGQALEAYALSSTDIATTGTDNTTDNDDNGLQMSGSGTMVMSPEFTLEPNTETATEPGPGGAQDSSDDDNGDMTKDFGFSPVVSIGSTVFADVDNDGQFEPQDGEDGIPGVVVEVWSTGLDGDKGTADDVLAGSDITDSNGDYFLGGLFPGEYYVVIPASEFGAGEPLQGQPWSSTPTDTNDNGEDNDDNGIQMGGQGTMVMSPEILLAANTEPVAPAEGGSGSTQDDAADANGDMTVDFGFVPSVSVGSLVWADANNNGQYESGESGIDGVEVQLWSPGPDGAKGGGDDVQIVTGADGILGTADDITAAPVLTSGGGLYYFGNLLPGSYYVVIPAPNAAYPLSSTPTDMNANNGEDNDDNGIQDGGSGTMAMSNV
ncbi:MAG: choice-of-anchor A family protein, partial [Phaeodactylibacter sp.]|nr:choice-of-anchor A family protein [Phaeodactylibacter sp.]